MTGTRTSHIDTIFTNFAGGHACHLFWYLWSQSAGHDHVALALIINAVRFDEEVETVTKPQSLALPAKVTGINKGLLEARLHQLFKDLWAWEYQHNFEQAIALRHLDEAHRIWCHACETFLLRFCREEWEAVLNANKPRRGQTLPRTTKKLAEQHQQQHCEASTEYTAFLQHLAGVALDLSRRLRRWTTAPQGRQGETDLNLQVELALEGTVLHGQRRDITPTDARDAARAVRKLLDQAGHLDVPKITTQQDGQTALVSA